MTNTAQPRTSTQPPLGLSQKQLNEAQNHADNMQALKNTLIEQKLMEEIAISRNSIAQMNLKSAMIEEQEMIIKSYPYDYVNELRAMNFPNSALEEPQTESIDITSQQPDENLETKEAGAEQAEERQLN